VDGEGQAGVVDVGSDQASARTAATAAGVVDGAALGDFTTASYLLVLDTHIINDTAADSSTNLLITSIKKLASAGCRTSKMVRKIGVYSFALKPEEHQPSGTCNFSRIDSAQLKVTHTTATDFTIYAVNYNVLRIMSGMGGLAYSN